MVAIPDVVGIAQLVRALDCGSRGRGFETLYPPSFSSSGIGEELKLLMALTALQATFKSTKARVAGDGM